jgi:hypothetical protein
MPAETTSTSWRRCPIGKVTLRRRNRRSASRAPRQCNTHRNRARRSRQSLQTRAKAQASVQRKASRARVKARRLAPRMQTRAKTADRGALTVWLSARQLTCTSVSDKTGNPRMTGRVVGTVMDTLNRPTTRRTKATTRTHRTARTNQAGKSSRTSACRAVTSV